MIEAESKLAGVSESIFATMSALANQYQAINLAQGFPDFSCSPELMELVYKYMKEGKNQYAPMPGVLQLRERISEKTFALQQISYNPDTEICVTPGATAAIYTVIATLINPGDEVVVIEPAYDSYIPVIELHGGKAVCVPLLYPDFSIDWELLQSSINEKTKLLIINTPHNPSGMIWQYDDMKKLELLLQETNVFLLSDEVYEHIIFEQNHHHSAASFPGLAERSFVISSFGKTYHNTGWKIGYCLAPAHLMKLFKQVFQFMVFSVNTPIQFALAEFMANKENYLSLASFYQQKRDYFSSLITNLKWKKFPCAGSYFQLLGYEAISDKSDIDFAKELTTEYKLASIPISVFYQNKLDQKVLRFCFAKEAATLEKAAEILNRI